MLFTEELRNETRLDYEKALSYFGDYEREIKNYIDELDGDAAWCMKFIYANLPLSDIADVAPVTLHSYVTHSLLIRDAMPWGNKIPVDLFLSDVLFPRINTEKIEDCRSILYEILKDRVAGKDMYDAVLEVNYWCLEQATYQTTDIRTSSPLVVMKRAYGRCGEESTFTVSALRSLGIPARQIYTPRWAHCDDNHAWTEAWCDGEWHYLGACEPAPLLDRGWFTSASARAMLLYSRSFYKHIKSKNTLARVGNTAALNHISSYAKATNTKVRVLKDGKPAVGAKVIFEILNFSEFAPLCSYFADENGEVVLESGLGSLNVHVIYQDRFVEHLVHTADTELLIVDMDKGARENTGTWKSSFETFAPLDAGKFDELLTPELAGRHQERFLSCTNIRHAREESFLINEPQIEDKDNQYSDEVIKNILFEAKGNAEEVIRFLGIYGKQAYEMLKQLTVKDYTDLDPDILESHIKHSLQYKETTAEELFYPYIMCPRVYFENITDYRPFLSAYFSDLEKEQFIGNPVKIWTYINERIEYKPDKEYENIYTSPEGTLRLGEASPMSQNILFVAICRTLGIPARLNPESQTVEYYSGSSFLSPLTEELLRGRLNIKADQDVNWVYLTNWTVGILDNGIYKTLKFSCKPWEVKDIPIASGHYRIITANRLPNGNYYANQYCFEVTDDNITDIEIELRSFELKDMLIDIKLNDFVLRNLELKETPMSALLQRERNIFLWLEENEEPTEHILNELGENAEKFTDLDCTITFILRKESTKENHNISRIAKLIPKINICYDFDFELHEPIARNLYVDPGKLPLATVLDNNGTAIYAFSGYNVGLSDLLIKIVTN